MTTLPPEGEQPEVPQAAPEAAAAPAAAPADSALNTITLNYWLSVFFSWLPALIFWLIEKDKGNARATQLHVANLNFSLLRVGVMILMAIPVVNIIAGIAGLVLFILHIIAAAKVANAYRNGTPVDPFMFNIPLIK